MIQVFSGRLGELRYAEATVRGWYFSGKIDPNTLVWTEASGTWVTLFEYFGLAAVDTLDGDDRGQTSAPSGLRGLLARFLPWARRRVS
ncbi:hypothetical protein ASA1KI_18320 [Opitutales bacterium ASA1]|nr:hypothetical protein ASA1KI_18320 [Opitutales bacterium ASA1]